MNTCILVNLKTVYFDENTDGQMDFWYFYMGQNNTGRTGSGSKWLQPTNKEIGTELLRPSRDPLLIGSVPGCGRCKTWIRSQPTNQDRCQVADRKNDTLELHVPHF